MNRNAIVITIRLVLTVGMLGIVLSSVSVFAQDSEVEGWPRVYDTDGDKLVIYQPQIQEWHEYARMRAVSAIQVISKSQEEGVFGTLLMEADTETNFQSRMVVFRNLRITEVRFPGVEKGLAGRCDAIVRKSLSPKDSVPISLDRVVAALERSQLQLRTIEVNLEPPPIYYSKEPAILVIFMGEPKFEPVEDTGLLFAANTNWDLFLDMKSQNYYLLNGESWLMTKDVLKGPWSTAKKLPPDLKKLPDDKNWEEVKKNVPGKVSKNLPKVLTSTGPAELIITDGKPSLSRIAGTSLFYVENTESNLFMFLDDLQYYVLTAGRWFKAKALDGKWTSASKDLPAEFAKIPKDHEKSSVLASVPGSAEAEAAVLLASIPQKAKVNRKDTTVIVPYEGQPEFAIIEDTTVYYALNTPYDVFRVSNKYYCCHKGVWFVSAKASGSWIVCTDVPKAIYKIPSTHPKYNVTYVYVYSSTPDVVVVGYTSGYSGSYVAATGALMFGLGYMIGHDDDHWHHHHYHYHPHYYSYGCGAHYDYYHGGYYRSARHYGPYGGAGRAASYNPTTGTYSRGAYRYGPSGGAFAAQAYNPYTDRYAARAGAGNTYGSWGRTVVADGDDWARAGHRSNWKGAVAGLETSQGGKAVAGKNKLTGQSAVVGKNKYGDVYAGRDGNIYKRNDTGSWQKKSGNSWETVNRNQLSRPTTTRTAPRTNQVQGQLGRDYSSRQTGSSRTNNFRQRSSGTRFSSPSRTPIRSGGRRRR